MAPEISVIVLTYNRENFVSRAVKSILNQTFSNFELIIVDNGSTDQSGKIADEFAVQDKRIRVFHKPKGNIGSGRNAGLDAAKGKYITFIDDDDWIEPDYLQFLNGLAETNHCDTAICGYDKEESGRRISSGVSDDLLIMDAEQAVITLLWRKQYNNAFPTKLFRRSLFNGLRFPLSGRYDDIALMYQVLAGAQKVASKYSVKYHFYRHDGNNSIATTRDHMITPEYLSEYRNAYRKRTEWLCGRFPRQSEYWWYFDWSFQISMVHKIISANLTDCVKQLKEMRNELSCHYDEFTNSPHALNFEKEWMNRYVDAS